MKLNLESRLLREISWYGDDTTLMIESEKGLKSLSMKVKQKSEKAGLILDIHKKKIMASGHHFMEKSWGNNGKSDRLYFLGLQNHCLW